MKCLKKLLFLPLISTLLFSCSSSINNVGKWLKIDTTELTIDTTYNGVKASPFGTVMKINYFKNEKKNYSDSFDEELKEYYFERVSLYHKIFDRHYKYYFDDSKESIYSSIRVINDSYATGREIPCSPSLYNLLKEGVEYTKISKGYFNFFIGNLVDYWDEVLDEVCSGANILEYDPYFSTTKQEELNAIVASNPSIDEIDNLLTFNDDNMSVMFNSIEDVKYNGTTLERSKTNSKYRPIISCGGFAKGEATKLIKQDLLAKGYKDGYLNSGSSSITLLSKPKFAEKGYISLKYADPRKSSFEREAAISLNIYDEVNISASGNYTSGLSYYIKDENGKPLIYRHHIVNPYTGENPQFHSQVLLISKYFDAGFLDMLSTAMFNMSLDDCLSFRKELLKKYSKSDLQMVLFDMDQSDKESMNIYSTSNFNNSLSLLVEKAKVIYLE